MTDRGLRGWLLLILPFERDETLFEAPLKSSFLVAIEELLALSGERIAFWPVSGTGAG